MGIDSKTEQDLREKISDLKDRLYKERVMVAEEWIGIKTLAVGSAFVVAFLVMLAQLDRHVSDWKAWLFIIPFIAVAFFVTISVIAKGQK